MNDANCFALSEAQDGSAAGATVVFGVILGIGGGGGIVIDGGVLTGRNAIAGECGHNSLSLPPEDEVDGERVGTGKSVAVRVDSGGGRSYQKKGIEDSERRRC